MSEEKTVYEVWNFAGSGSPELVSDDPIEIVYWLRARPRHDRGFNVHPKGLGFHRDKKISHDFISLHYKIVADDMVKKAFETGKSEGLAQAIIDLAFGR